MYDERHGEEEHPEPILPVTTAIDMSPLECVDSPTLPLWSKMDELERLWSLQKETGAFTIRDVNEEKREESNLDARDENSTVVSSLGESSVQSDLGESVFDRLYRQRIRNVKSTSALFAESFKSPSWEREAKSVSTSCLERRLNYTPNTPAWKPPSSDKRGSSKLSCDKKRPSAELKNTPPSVFDRLYRNESRKKKVWTDPKVKCKVRVIQSWWRMVTFRSRYHRIREAALILQSLARRSRTKKSEREIIRIQIWYRKVLACREKIARIRQQESACSIQSASQQEGACSIQSACQQKTDCTIQSARPQLQTSSNQPEEGVEMVDELPEPTVSEQPASTLDPLPHEGSPVCTIQSARPEPEKGSNQPEEGVETVDELPEPTESEQPASTLDPLSHEGSPACTIQSARPQPETSSNQPEEGVETLDELPEPTESEQPASTLDPLPHEGSPVFTIQSTRPQPETKSNQPEEGVETVDELPEPTESEQPASTSDLLLRGGTPDNIAPEETNNIGDQQKSACTIQSAWRRSRQNRTRHNAARSFQSAWRCYRLRCSVICIQQFIRERSKKKMSIVPRDSSSALEAYSEALWSNWSDNPCSVDIAQLQSFCCS